MSSTSDPGCAVVDDDLAALAVGTLTGRERAEVLRHLEHCPACAAELEELSAAADALVELIPEAAPPEGFAARTVASMGSEPRAVPPSELRAWRRPGRWRVVAAAAVVVVVLGVGLGLGRALAPSGGTGPGDGVRTAALVSSSGASGTVVVSPGGRGWLLMTLDDGPASGRVTCMVTTADGSRRAVGNFTLSSAYGSSAGYGSWAVRLPVAASSVRSVSVVDDRGRTVASASLPN